MRTIKLMYLHSNSSHSSNVLKWWRKQNKRRNEKLQKHSQNERYNFVCVFFAFVIIQFKSHWKNFCLNQNAAAAQTCIQYNLTDFDQTVVLYVIFWKQSTKNQKKAKQSEITGSHIRNTALHSWFINIFVLSNRIQHCHFFCQLKNFH